jgi:hypothetical protein
MRNFIRKLMGKKPVYKVKAWNVEFENDWTRWYHPDSIYAHLLVPKK